MPIAENSREICLREKRLPMRMCLVCRKRFPKSELTRFVFTDGLPQEDAKQNLAGRGYYVCADGGCREKWLRRAARR
ncbi:MAG: DUF448 domain-containing protein [Deltaproteobacteria bacterium]|jgi:predicted RNA-binding protein YlxR (DUF448 family)|nr:DUF448 domain-containing protein [Deltaproteobacteria bacterium]